MTSPPEALRRSSSGAASAIRRPLRQDGDRVAILGFARRSASSPRACGRRRAGVGTPSQTVWRSIGSSPAVGSSTNSSTGSWTRAHASSSRRCMPPESWRARRLRASHRSTSFSTCLTRRPRLRPQQPEQRGDERDVFGGGQLVVQHEVLRHVADLLAGTAREFAGVLAQHRQPAFGRREGTGEHADQGGLARAARTDDAQDRAARDVQADVVDGGQVAEAAADAVHRDDWHVRVTRGRLARSVPLARMPCRMWHWRGLRSRE